MIPVSFLIALVFAIVFPVLSGQGKGWRGLWFGLAIAGFAVFAFLTVMNTGTRVTPEKLGVSLENQTGVAVIEGVNDVSDVVIPVLALGTFLGCLIAGCVYRKPAAPKAAKEDKEPTIQLED